MSEEMSCLKIDRDPADRGGKIIPAARNGEQECSGEGF